MRTLIDQIASEISIQVERLDEIRRQGFLTWLHAHQRIVLADQHTSVTGVNGTEFTTKVNSPLKNSLIAWLELLPLQSLLIEYRLILEEISWWYGLEANTLTDWILRNNRKAGE
jgi:hypothetical protein